MNFLVDTNIATRLAEPGHAMHQAALDAVKLLVAQGHKLHIVPQTLYEFWVVSTRPTSVNGMGRTAAEAISELATLKALFSWLDETAAVFGVWEQLVRLTPVLGKNADDARLVAAMVVHGLTHLLTFNTRDFRQYAGITVVSPAEILKPGTACARGTYRIDQSTQNPKTNSDVPLNATPDRVDSALRNYQAEFGDIIQPMTEAQNYSGKAYTIRQGESLIGWLQRGSREHGETREKFKKTIFSNVRMAMKLRAVGGLEHLMETPESEQLAPAYESVRSRAVELTHQAGLDPYAAEVILSAAQAAHATLVYGPNMANLVVHRLMELIESGVPIADASAEATQWTQDKMVVAKTSAGNPYGDDEEAIAAAILAEILSGE